MPELNLSLSISLFPSSFFLHQCSLSQVPLSFDLRCRKHILYLRQAQQLLSVEFTGLVSAYAAAPPAVLVSMFTCVPVHAFALRLRKEADADKSFSLSALFPLQQRLSVKKSCSQIELRAEREREGDTLLGTPRERERKSCCRPFLFSLSLSLLTPSFFPCPPLPLRIAP